MIRRALFLLALSSVAALLAQEFRALISGSVTDPSGAAVPAAVVTAVNNATNVRTAAKSAGDGNYVIAQLPPGPYDLTVEAPGFQKYTRSGVTLNVGDKATIRVRLEVGATSESITVNAGLTGIEQNQSVTGQLMDNRKVSELPLNGRQVFMLLQLSAGVLFTQQQFGATGFSGTRAWDVNGNYSMHGSRANTNAFLLDGAPLGVSGAWDYAPLVDAVEEFKVSAFANDASHGLTGGGAVNMTMKSGANQLHGLASEFFRNNVFDAVATQTNRAAAQRPDLKNQQHQWNSFAGMLSGPIIKNKFFYSGHYEGYRQRVPFPVTVTFPTAEQRTGDFSNTLNASRNLIVVYDPLSTRQAGSSYARDPFPGNRLPSQRIVPVAQNILKFVPMPNIVTNPITNFNNFAASPNVGQYRYDAYYVKFDYFWNSSHRTFASHTQNHGSETRTGNGIPVGNPAKQGPDPNNRAHYAATLDHVWTVNPTTVLNARIAWDRYYWLRRLTSNDAFDGSTLGFKGRSGANTAPHFPIVTMTNYTVIGANVDRMFQPNDTYTSVVDLSRTAGRHFLKFGMRAGQARFSRSNKGDLDGLFAFTPAFTQRDPQRGDTTSGQAVASFLLGYPASGGTDTNPESSYVNYFLGLYVQDDFRVTPKLTLNLGARWDLQTPSTERYNRGITGFDPNATYTLGQAQARGGFTFADKDHRQSWSKHYRDFQPRLGAAYQMTSKLVWRAGYGLSFLPINGTGGPTDILQTGYARRTPLVPTIGGGLNSFIPARPGAGTLENPFPDGILQPYGSSLGPKTQVGQAITYLSSEYVIPRVHQFNVGFDYDLPWKTTLEISYVGNRTRRFPVSKQTDAISLAERLKGFADPNYLNASVPNPFAGAPELAGTGLAAATITRTQSLRPFPQFTGVTNAGLALGSTSYNAMELRFNKRLTNGLVLTGTYTWAKIIDRSSFREDQYQETERVISALDRSQHLAINALYDLPFGRGRAIGSHWGKIPNAVFGSWQYNIIVEAMTGTSTNLPDATPARDPKLSGGAQSYDRWFDTCTLLTNGQRSNCASANAPVTWVQLKPNELRTYSSRFPNVRNPSRPQINMSVFKTFPIRERFRLEFRAESFNSCNTPIYAGPDISITSPNFGVVTRDQQNFPRSMQFALRLLF